MRLLFAFLLITLFVQTGFAQPTEAEIKKQVEEALKKAEKMTDDPELKKAIEDAKKSMNGKKDPADSSKPNSPKTGTTAQVGQSKPIAAFQLADRNDKFLNALPLRTFNKVELVSYLKNLNKKLTAHLRTQYRVDISKIPVYSAGKTSNTGIGLYLDNQCYGSALLALRAAEMDPENPTLLNNAGGILVNTGFAVNAIPILQYILEKNPTNNLLLNNLGQAYLALGDEKKAEQYLSKCIQNGKYYPDANLAMAYINNKRGNKAAAISYAENSLRGSYTTKAYNLLHYLRPDPKMMDLIRHRYKAPDVFNYHKYPLLPQCRTVDSIPVLRPQYRAYYKMLTQLEDKYRKLGEAETEIYSKSSYEKLRKLMAAGRSPSPPFGSFAYSVLVSIEKEHNEKFMRHVKYRDNYRVEYNKLVSSYKEAINAVSGCDAKNSVTNAYLPRFAELTEAWQAETINLYKNYLNDKYYWECVAAIDEHGAKLAFYNMAYRFIGTLKEISDDDRHTLTYLYPCLETKDASTTKEPIVLEIPDCFLGPLKIVLPLGVINLELSCEAYKLEAGEGLVGKIEYDRKSGDVTLAIGVGVSLPKVKFAGLSEEVDAKSQLFITFDNFGNITDAGVLWEAELKLAVAIGEVKGEMTLFEDALTVGFGSGVQMKEGGVIKGLIDNVWAVQPDASQMDKKVPLYK